MTQTKTPSPTDGQQKAEQIELTPEDDEILDAVWDQIGKEEQGDTEDEDDGEDEDTDE